VAPALRGAAIRLRRRGSTIVERERPPAGSALGVQNRYFEAVSRENEAIRAAAAAHEAVLLNVGGFPWITLLGSLTGVIAAYGLFHRRTEPARGYALFEPPPAPNLAQVFTKSYETLALVAQEAARAARCCGYCGLPAGEGAGSCRGCGA
jgi:hypothetical protein